MNNQHITRPKPPTQNCDRDKSRRKTHPLCTMVLALSGSSSKAFTNCWSAFSNWPMSHRDCNTTIQNLFLQGLWVWHNNTVQYLFLQGLWHNTIQYLFLQGLWHNAVPLPTGTVTQQFSTSSYRDCDTTIQYLFLQGLWHNNTIQYLFLQGLWHKTIQYLFLQGLWHNNTIQYLFLQGLWHNNSVLLPTGTVTQQHSSVPLPTGTVTQQDNLVPLPTGTVTQFSTSSYRDCDTTIQYLFLQGLLQSNTTQDLFLHTHYSWSAWLVSHRDCDKTIQFSTYSYAVQYSGTSHQLLKRPINTQRS